MISPKSYVRGVFVALAIAVAAPLAGVGVSPLATPAFGPWGRRLYGWTRAFAIAGGFGILCVSDVAICTEGAGFAMSAIRFSSKLLIASRTHSD